MNDTENGNLFPVRKPKHKSVLLTQQEAAILRVANAYGISPEATAKMILHLRAKKKAAAVKKATDLTAL